MIMLTSKVNSLIFLTIKMMLKIQVATRVYQYKSRRVGFLPINKSICLKNHGSSKKNKMKSNNKNK